MYIKNGAPISDVSTPRGISYASRVRQQLSTTSINKAPVKSEKRIRVLLLGPEINLTRCGIISPTHPIVPAIDTTEAVSKVAHIMQTILTVETLIPIDFASSSPKDKRLSFHLKCHNRYYPKHKRYKEE